MSVQAKEHEHTVSSRAKRAREEHETATDDLQALQDELRRLGAECAAAERARDTAQAAADDSASAQASLQCDVEELRRQIDNSSNQEVRARAPVFVRPCSC